MLVVLVVLVVVSRLRKVRVYAPLAHWCGVRCILWHRLAWLRCVDLVGARSDLSNDICRWSSSCLSRHWGVGMPTDDSSGIVGVGNTGPHAVCEIHRQMR